MSLKSQPFAAPSSSKNQPNNKTAENSFKRSVLNFIYDKSTKRVLGRTPISWLQIITYSIMYLIFLMTYTLLLLYIALTIIQEYPEFTKKSRLESYAHHGIGLTLAPAVTDKMLISYSKGNENEWQPYVNYLDSFFDVRNRSKRDTSRSELGPCGSPPYGYGEAPCVIIRINKQIGWSAKALTPGTPAADKAPLEVQEWSKTDKKLWLHCSGMHTWDAEHIEEVKYHPHPPGFDPSLYPMNMTSRSPLVAVQFTKFSLGISLAIECKMFYDMGTSSVSFVLYVDAENASIANRIV